MPLAYESRQGLIFINCGRVGAGYRFNLDVNRNNAMINTRYKKLTGMHADHVYVVTAPYGEVESPLRWMLHCEAASDEKLIVPEDELTDRKRWQPLD